MVEDRQRFAFDLALASRPAATTVTDSVSHHSQKYAKLLKDEEDSEDDESIDSDEEGDFDDGLDGLDQFDDDDDDEGTDDSAFGEDGISDEELMDPGDDDDHEEMGEIGSEGSDEEEGMIDFEEESDEEESDAVEEEEGGKTVRFAAEHMPGVNSTSTTTPVAPPASTSTSAPTRYIPPHLRASASAPLPTPTTPLPSSTLQALPEDPRLRRTIMGHLNKLSSTNLPVILNLLLQLYSTHPRAQVSTTLTTLLLEIISGRDNLGEQLVVTYAVLIAALARNVGIEMSAGVVARAVGMFDESLKKNVEARAKGEEVDGNGGFEGRPGSKECENLVALLAELYNFQVVACVLVYDLVRLFIDSGLEELEVELLVKIVKREFVARASGSRRGCR